MIFSNKMIFSAIMSVGLIFSSCSSAKNRAMFVTDVHSRAAKLYDGANKEIAAGNFGAAKTMLESAYSLATAIDDEELLCRICVSSYNCRISAKDSEADAIFSEKSADDLLYEAKMYADFSGNPELAAVIAIFEAKGTISLGKDKNALKNHIDLIQNRAKKLKKSPFYLALSYRTQADLYFRLDDFASAANLYEKAASVHTKNRYLSEIGTDWYYAALSHSRAGNKADAIRAIQNALKYDKDAENISAIASDYSAYSKILLKGNPSAEEKSKAQKALERAEKIKAAAKSAEE